MKVVKCPVCGMRVRKNQLARHRAAAHPERKGKSRLALPLAAAAIAAVVVLASAYIYLARRAADGGTEVVPPLDPNAVAVAFQTEDGWRIQGTFYRGSPSAPLVILVHGISEDRGAFGSLVPELRSKDYNILAYDSRGHGQSTVQDDHYRDWKSFSDQDFQSMVNDLSSAKYYALSNFASAPKIAIVGASIGANEALTFAAQTNATDNKALGLLSPGDDYRGVKSAPALDSLNQEGASLHIFFSAADGDTPSAAAARSLEAAYNGSKTMETLSGARHGTQLLTDPPFRAKLVDFLADAFSS